MAESMTIKLVKKDSGSYTYNVYTNIIVDDNKLVTISTKLKNSVIIFGGDIKLGDSNEYTITIVSDVEEKDKC